MKDERRCLNCGQLPDRCTCAITEIAEDTIATTGSPPAEPRYSIAEIKAWAASDGMSSTIYALNWIDDHKKGLSAFTEREKGKR